MLGRRFGMEAVLFGSVVLLAAGVLLCSASIGSLVRGAVALGGIAFGSVLLPTHHQILGSHSPGTNRHERMNLGKIGGSTKLNS